MLLLLFLLASIPAVAQVKQPPIEACAASDMMRFVYQNDLVRALAESEGCVAYFKKQVSQQASESWTDRWSGIFQVGYYLCAKAQLLTMTGSNSKAESALSEAEEFANYYHDFYGNFLVANGWKAAFYVTKGMVLERKEEDRAAGEAYRNCASAWGGYCAGRLALLLMRERNDVEASGWARAGAVGKDPTALAVLGALDESKGDDGGAFASYYEAQKVMESYGIGHNEFLPVLLAEHHRVAEGLSRLGSRAPRVVAKDGKRQFYDENGDLAGWEGWPHVLYSAEIKAKQDEYNAWLENSVRPGVAGIALRPQYPRFFVGLTLEDQAQLVKEGRSIPGAVTFSVPERIEPTGVLDLDTLAIPFYKELVAVARLAQSDGLALSDLQSRTAPSAGAADGPLRAAQAAELRRAMNALQDFYNFLEGVKMTTAAGSKFNAWDESRQYASFQKSLQASVSSQNVAHGAVRYRVPANMFEGPPDFLTAHLDTPQLTPEFLESMASLELHVKAHVFAARELLP